MVSRGDGATDIEKTMHKTTGLAFCLQPPAETEALLGHPPVKIKLATVGGASTPLVVDLGELGEAAGFW